MAISKRDMFQMTRRQATAGMEMWRRTGQQGRLAKSSFDAEAMAPKTWVLWANAKGEEIKTIECELYVVGRASDPTEGIGMLVGMCPIPDCGEHFMVREDNKTMHVERVRFRRAPAFVKVNWTWHCKNVLGRRPSDEDVIPVVSSPERWACDYCRQWCVKVIDGIAKTDMTGVTQITVSQRAALINRG